MPSNYGWSENLKYASIYMKSYKDGGRQPLVHVHERESGWRSVEESNGAFIRQLQSRDISWAISSYHSVPTPALKSV